MLGNIDAMAWGVGELASSRAITVDGILECHRRLLGGSGLSEHAGRIRTVQNWIGGSSFNPCSAAYVPPPPGFLEDLLADLCAFANEETLPALAQAAIVHAQFETIHPFIDGNGRTGRVLIHAVLRRRGLAPRILPPVSLVLATWSDSYVGGLTATRYRGSPESAAAHDGLNRWIALFAAASRRAVDDAAAFEQRVGAIQAQWRRALGPVRAGSAVESVLAALPGAPIVSVNGAAELIGRSFQATNKAFARLEAAGVIRQLTIGRRNRAFEATAVIDAFADLERQLATPSGETGAEPPLLRDE
ncbi:MAG TPA: Fic family protein [Actinomycetota bacterium]